MVKKGRIQHIDIPLGLRGQVLSASQYNTVAAFREITIQRDSCEPILFAQTHVGDDGNAQPELHVFLDNLPASGLQGHFVAEIMLAEDQIDDSPGAQMTWWQDQAKDQMCGFDVFVLPSLYEGFPFAILEAMSAGLPCVVSDVDGNGESVLHEKTGYVLPVSDTEQWVNSLQTLINTRNKRAEFGCAGFDRFQQEFDVSVMARRTMAVYEKVRGVNRVPSA